MVSLLDVLNYAGTAAFATSGALLAARYKLDIVGFIFIANITGIGGGTLRDVVLDVDVFWLEEWGYVFTCSLAAVMTYSATRFVSKGTKALLWADAVGMALFSVLGAQKALSLGVTIQVAAIMGVFSACLGGVIRDIIFNEVPIIFQREIYITASILGVLAYGTCYEIYELHVNICILVGCITAFLIRALAISYKLSIPSHKGLQ